MKRYLIILEEDCQECGGSGVISNDAWTEYNKWENEYCKKHAISPGEFLTSHKSAYQDWWQNNYGTNVDFDRGIIPWEEAECDGCGGTGKVRTDIELSEALKELHKTPHVEVL